MPSSLSTAPAAPAAWPKICEEFCESLARWICRKLKKVIMKSELNTISRRFRTCLNTHSIYTRFCAGPFRTYPDQKFLPACPACDHSTRLPAKSLRETTLQKAIVAKKNKGSQAAKRPSQPCLPCSTCRQCSMLHGISILTIPSSQQTTQAYPQRKQQ